MTTPYLMCTTPYSIQSTTHYPDSNTQPYQNNDDPLDPDNKTPLFPDIRNLFDLDKYLFDPDNNTPLDPDNTPCDPDKNTPLNTDNTLLDMDDTVSDPYDTLFDNSDTNIPLFQDNNTPLNTLLDPDSTLLNPDNNIPFHLENTSLNPDNIPLHLDDSTATPFTKQSRSRSGQQYTTFSAQQCAIVPSQQQQSVPVSLLMKQDDDGDTPLHIAVAKEDMAAVTRYLQAHCNIDVLNSDRQTPLHIAIITNQKECVRLLLRSGANIEIATTRGSNSLHLAVKHGNCEIISSLLTHRKASHCLSMKDFEGFSVLHVAVNTRRVDVVATLLPYVNNINIGDGKSGRSPLFHAVENRDEEMVNLLLKHHANANATNYAGSTPLVAASGRSYYNIAVALVSYGAKTKGYDFMDIAGHSLQSKVSLKTNSESVVVKTALKRKLESSKYTHDERLPVSSTSQVRLETRGLEEPLVVTNEGIAETATTEAPEANGVSFRNVYVDSNTNYEVIIISDNEETTNRYDSGFDSLGK